MTYMSCLFLGEKWTFSSHLQITYINTSQFICKVSPVRGQWLEHRAWTRVRTECETKAKSDGGHIWKLYINLAKLSRRHN